MKLPKVHYGKVGSKPKNWRDEKPEFDPDDEELQDTPADVLKMLGFDPKEIRELSKHKGRQK